MYIIHIERILNMYRKKAQKTNNKRLKKYIYIRDLFFLQCNPSFASIDLFSTSNIDSIQTYLHHGYTHT